jgi:hypothetical protein
MGDDALPILLFVVIVTDVSAAVIPISIADFRDWIDCTIE